MKNKGKIPYPDDHWEATFVSAGSDPPLLIIEALAFCVAKSQNRESVVFRSSQHSEAIPDRFQGAKREECSSVLKTGGKIYALSQSQAACSQRSASSFPKSQRCKNSQW